MLGQPSSPSPPVMPRAIVRRAIYLPLRRLIDDVKARVGAIQRLIRIGEQKLPEGSAAAYHAGLRAANAVVERREGVPPPRGGDLPPPAPPCPRPRQSGERRVDLQPRPPRGGGGAPPPPQHP